MRPKMRRTRILPMPPLEMRELVGPTDPRQFDNPEGWLVYPDVPADKYESFFDFGCGCGRVARKLIQQRVPPIRYVGVDLHKGMIDWAQRNLAPAAEGFDFIHHDVHNVRFNPTGAVPPMERFPVGDQEFTFVHALSVFTHLTQSQAEYYVPEVARILHSDGVFLGSWLLFDKTYFPFMGEDYSALYVNYVDPSAAVLFDRRWVQALAAKCGLVISSVMPPTVRGHQWILQMQTEASGADWADWPTDDAPIGDVVTPMGSEDPHLIR
jgi:SAM-dependent methyltransferase